MKHLKAGQILPPELLREVQKYAGGRLLYIPLPEAPRRCWGECSGAREELSRRNRVIREARRTGVPFEELSRQYCLSVESIRKIVYSKNG